MSGRGHRVGEVITVGVVCLGGSFENRNPSEAEIMREGIGGRDGGMQGGRRDGGKEGWIEDGGRED